MSTRASLDGKLAAIRSLRGEELTPEHKAELRKRLGNRSNLIVAAASAIAGENALIEMAPELAAAYDRFLVNPLKDDKLCRPKIAVIQALDRMEYTRPDVLTRSHALRGNAVLDAPRPLRTARRLALRATPNPDDAERRGRHSHAERGNECFYSRVPIDGALQFIVKWDHLAYVSGPMIVGPLAPPGLQNSTQS